MGEPITKEHLRNYKSWRIRVEMDEEELARAESASYFKPMRESDGSQHQPGGSDGMGAAIRKMELENRLRPIIEEHKRKMQRIEDAIDSLCNPMEQNVLRARYIVGDPYEVTTWADVAMKIYRRDDENAVQNATRLHGRALKSIAKEEF